MGTKLVMLMVFVFIVDESNGSGWECYPIGDRFLFSEVNKAYVRSTTIFVFSFK